jgi:chlorite dismutase
MTRSFLLAFVLLTAWSTTPAAEVGRQDVLAIHDVVADQLDAFARDDAQRAFSLASASIREQFKTPEKFIAMVRSGYPAIYRHRAAQFEQPDLIAGEVIQPVRLTDEEGRSWIALYPMQRQRDGSWRINGCQLARMAGIEA